jgi:hypothetical protein
VRKSLLEELSLMIGKLNDVQQKILSYPSWRMTNWMLSDLIWHFTRISSKDKGLVICFVSTDDNPLTTSKLHENQVMVEAEQDMETCRNKFESLYVLKDKKVL